MRTPWIRRLRTTQEIAHAVAFFAEAIPRHWPNTKEEAHSLVEQEFHHPAAVVLGAYTHECDLVAVCALVPFELVWARLTLNEHVLLDFALRAVAAECVIPSDYVHWGGLAVGRAWEGTGLAQCMNIAAESWAQLYRRRIMIAQSGRACVQYPLLRGIPYALKCGYQELATATPLYYRSPPDLEKVWLWKK